MTTNYFHDQVKRLTTEVTKSAKYAAIHVKLVESLVAREIKNGRSEKEVIKAVRNKLHQVGGAFVHPTPRYERWISELTELPFSLQDQQLQLFCKSVLGYHVSSRERLPALESFYHQVLTPLLPIDSILDLACGFNPLARSWMPLGADCKYLACDMYTDLVDFLNVFFLHTRVSGEAFACDLVSDTPGVPVQVALLLKTLPCLEQIDKTAGTLLLDNVKAENWIISFPSHSLGGQGKGMLQNYEQRFRELIEGRFIIIERFEFPGELVFLIKR